MRNKPIRPKIWGMTKKLRMLSMKHWKLKSEGTPDFLKSTRISKTDMKVMSEDCNYTVLLFLTRILGTVAGKLPVAKLRRLWRKIPMKSQCSAQICQIQDNVHLKIAFGMVNIACGRTPIIQTESVCCEIVVKIKQFFRLKNKVVGK